MRTSENYKCCKNYDGTLDEVKQTNGLHYAKAVCIHCKHFIKWLPNPNITKRIEERNKEIDKLLSENSDNLTEKQKNFLQDIKIKRFPTLKQQQYLEGLTTKYFTV